MEQTKTPLWLELRKEYIGNCTAEILKEELYKIEFGLI